MVAEVLVMVETTSTPEAIWIVTSVLTGPGWILTIFPLRTLRALIFVARGSVRGWIRPTYHTGADPCSGVNRRWSGPDANA